MKINELNEASYRGAFWFISNSDIDGGRKDAKKEFISSSRQNIEDFGLKQRAFSMRGTISERRDNAGGLVTSYKQARDLLLDALEKGGTGIFIHPWYGRIEDVVCRTFSINENINKLGEASITIKFEISNTDGIPIASQYGRTRVSKFHETLLASMKITLEESWVVSAFATGNFEAGIAKLGEFITTLNTSTDPIATLASKINGHTNLVTNFSNDIVALVDDPTSLSDSVSNVMASVGGLYATPEGMIAAFAGLFDFGDNDVNLPQTTRLAIERKQNNDVMNSAIQASALSYSYLNASDIEYSTVDQITEQASDLEVQYQKLFDGTLLEQEIIDGLTDLRVVTQEFFDEQKLTASQVITVRSNPMSTRLLAFYHYGSSERGEEIAELNEFYDLAFQQGEIRIFTA